MAQKYKFNKTDPKGDVPLKFSVNRSNIQNKEEESIILTVNR